MTVERHDFWQFTEGINSLNTLYRRQMLSLASAATLCFTTRPCLSVRSSTENRSMLRLSLAAYSVRSLLTDPKSDWDLFRFVNYCRELGIGGAELTSYYFPKEVTTDYLLELKQHCHRQGVSISGGAIRNDFCTTDSQRLANDILHTKRWIDHYAVLGAPVIRIFAGEQSKDTTWEATIEQCASACREVAAYAKTKGLFLGLENHGGVTAKASGLLEIVNRVSHPNLGINFDSGNFRSTDDPYGELASIASLAVNAQIKLSIAPGGKTQPTDLERVVTILREANYSGWVALEYEEKDPPLEAIPGWIERLKPLMG